MAGSCKQWDKNKSSPFRAAFQLRDGAQNRSCGPNVTLKLLNVPLFRKISSPASRRSPKAPQKPSTPAPGYIAQCVPPPPTPEMAFPTVPGVTAAFVFVKLMNPTFPVTKNLNGPGVWNLGPNSPVNGRTLVVTNDVVAPLLNVVVKFRSKS